MKKEGKFIIGIIIIILFLNIVLAREKRDERRDLKQKKANFPDFLQKHAEKSKENNKDGPIHKNKFERGIQTPKNEFNEKRKDLEKVISEIPEKQRGLSEKLINEIENYVKSEKILLFNRNNCLFEFFFIF